MVIGVSACRYASREDSTGLATGRPGMNAFLEKSPGETEVLERAYLGAPPFVPHSVEGLEITVSDNACISCHGAGMEMSEGHTATKIPPSHYLNEHTGEKSEDQVLGIRYRCLQCHVPQASVSP